MPTTYMDHTIVSSHHTKAISGWGSLVNMNKLFNASRAIRVTSQTSPTCFTPVHSIYNGW
jgi:hypothetical protein